MFRSIASADPPAATSCIGHRRDDGVIGLLEFCQQRFVGDGRKRRCHSRLEKSAIAVHLLDGDLGVDAGRILEIRSRLCKRRGHRLLARDQLPQAFFGWRKIALDHDVGRARQAAAVAVGIEGPWPHGFERQQPRVDRAQQLLAVELLLGDSDAASIAATRSRNCRAEATPSSTAWRE